MHLSLLIFASIAVLTSSWISSSPRKVWVHNKPLSSASSSLRLKHSIQTEFASTEASPMLHENTTILQATNIFVENVQSALLGKTEALLKTLSPNVIWKNPVLSDKSSLNQTFSSFANFAIEPRIYAYAMKAVSDDKVKLRYQLSYTHPLPWRPRLIIPAIATITYNADHTSITAIEEKWEFSLGQWLLKLFPRLWDVWHVFPTNLAEYPPVKTLARTGSVSLVELPETVVLEICWRGSGKYPGPPLQVMPSFGLFGDLTSRGAKAAPYYAILPVEVSSSRFDQNGEEMKQTTWVLHVPTPLQALVKDRLEEIYPIEFESLLDIDSSSEEKDKKEDDDDEIEADFKQQRDKASFAMSSVKGGAFRGDYILDVERASDLEAKQSISYRYRVLPRRRVVMTSARGLLDASKISQALARLRSAIDKKKFGESVRQLKVNNMKSAFPLPDGVQNFQHLFDAHLQSVKAAFNEKAQPAMAVYEMQYNLQRNDIFLEVE